MVAMCRKRTRGWDDDSSVGSSDSNEGDAEDVTDDGQRGDSDRSEEGGSEGEDDDGSVGSSDSSESDGEDGSEGGVSSTDDHFGSQELHEIHELVDAEWRQQ